MKLIIVLALLAVIASLGVALVRLSREGGSASRATVQALTWRIGLSIALFLFILLAIHLGWISPHGVAPSGR